MARRIVNTQVVNPSGDTFVLELWDTQSSATDLDYNLLLDASGISVDWGAVTDYGALSPSSLSFTAFLTEVQRSAIMPLVYNNEEFRLAARVYRNGVVWWTGIMHAEMCSEVIDDGTITVTFGGSCGLAMLDTIDFKDGSGNQYNGRATAIEVVWNVLKKLPHISLFYPTATVAVQTWNLSKPLTTASSFTYESLSPVDSTYRGTLDYLTIPQSAFYVETPVENGRIVSEGILNRERINPSGFVSCKMVLTNVMSSLGATIAMADGRFQIWDWARNIVDSTTGSVTLGQYTVTSGGSLEYGESTDVQEVDITANRFRKGAVRRGLYAYRSAIQRHVGGGTDLFWGKGLYGAVTSPLLQLGQASSLPDWVGNWVIFSEFPKMSAATAAERRLDSVLNGDIQDLSLPPESAGGKVRIKMGGRANWGSSTEYGAYGLVRFRVEASDGVTTYRLSRPVRTIAYTSSSTSASPVLYSMNITGQTRNYYPKFWSGTYEWVEATEGHYNNAFLEIPLGFDSNVIVEGQSQRIGIDDFPLLQMYAPARTKLVTDSTNELQGLVSLDAFDPKVLWRHDVTYDAPTTGGATIESITVTDMQVIELMADSIHNSVYDENGNILEVGGHYWNGDDYRTELAGVTGNGNTPSMLGSLVVNRIEVWNGEDATDNDVIGAYYPDSPNGYEPFNFPDTRVSASFVNSGGSAQRRYLTGSYLAPTEQEDNIKWERGWDNTVTENSLLTLNCRNFIDARGRVREMVNGSLFQPWTGGEIVYPHTRFSTTRLSGSSELFAPLKVSYSTLEGEQPIEAVKVAGAGISGTTLVNDEVRNPNGRPGGVKPDDGILEAVNTKVNTSKEVTDIIDISGFSGTISVTDIDNTINLVQVTSPITDSDLGGGGGGSDLFSVFISKRR